MDKTWTCKLTVWLWGSGNQAWLAVKLQNDSSEWQSVEVKSYALEIKARNHLKTPTLAVLSPVNLSWKKITGRSCEFTSRFLSMPFKEPSPPFPPVLIQKHTDELAATVNHNHTSFFNFLSYYSFSLLSNEPEWLRHAFDNSQISKRKKEEKKKKKSSSSHFQIQAVV